MSTLTTSRVDAARTAALDLLERVLAAASTALDRACAAPDPNPAVLREARLAAAAVISAISKLTRPTATSPSRRADRRSQAPATPPAAAPSPPPAAAERARTSTPHDRPRFTPPPVFPRALADALALIADPTLDFGPTMGRLRKQSKSSRRSASGQELRSLARSPPPILAAAE